MDGIITFKDMHELDIILSNLDTGMYDVRLNAIEENYERAKKYHSDNDVVPRLTSKIIKEVNK